MNPDFSHDDVLAKMDALLKKHHDALAPAHVVADFPLLTEVVEVEEPVEMIPVLTEVIENGTVQPEAAAAPGASPLCLSDETVAQLDRQIRAILEQRLPFHIVEAVDKALPVVLEEFSMQLESLVRDAVAQELQKQLSRIHKQM